MKKLLVILSVAILGLTSCSTIEENPNTAKGVGVGAAAGGILGAIIGNQSGSSEKGAVIGAVLGGTIGGVVGKRMDKQAKELAVIAETKRTEQGLITKLKSDILFDTGKADLKAAAKENLKQMATIMKKYPENILTIKGYTDNTGTEATNQVLSKRRAEAVMAVLSENGLSNGVMSAVGMGPANPVAENGTIAGRQSNRRVEVEVTVDQTKVPKS